MMSPFLERGHNKMQFTKWDSKTRLTGTQALDKVWSHLKKHVSKSLCSRSSLIDASIPEWNSMCTATCGASTTETGGKSSDNCANNTEKKPRVRMKVFFFSVIPTSQSKIAKIEFRTQFWRVSHTSVKIQNRKKRGSYQ